MADGELVGLERPQHRQRDLGRRRPARVCSRRNHSRSTSLAKAEQPDLVLAHIGLDREHGRLTGGRQLLQRARGALHLIADAADVEDHEVLAIGVDDAFELADHRAVPCGACGRA